MNEVFDDGARNRETTALAVLDVRIEHADGVRSFDPNAMAMAAIKGELLQLAAKPDTYSVLSGQAALVYRSDDLAVSLTPAEMTRLVALELREPEFFALQARYGAHFMWHDDFYDMQTGAALQGREVAGADGYEDPPPPDRWPQLAARPAPNELAKLRFLVTHPMVASGHWELVRASGEKVQGDDATRLSSREIAVNLEMLESKRLHRLGSPSASPRP